MRIAFLNVNAHPGYIAATLGLTDGQEITLTRMLTKDQAQRVLDLVEGMIPEIVGNTVERLRHDQMKQLVELGMRDRALAGQTGQQDKAASGGGAVFDSHLGPVRTYDNQAGQADGRQTADGRPAGRFRTEGGST